MMAALSSSSEAEEIRSAVRSKNPKQLKLLLETASRDSIENLLNCVDMIHSCASDVHCLRILLDYVPNIDKVYGLQCEHGTLLMLAVIEGQLDCVRLLLDKGANVDLRDRNGNSALLYACNDKHEEIFDLLIQQRADIHKASKMGTAVMHAAQNNANRCLRKLLALGASIQDGNSFYKTPLLVASIYGHKELVNTVLYYIDNLKKEEKIDYINIKDGEGKSALIWACKNGNIATVDILLKHGANMNAQNLKGKTAIMLAVENNCFECFKLLYKEGADLDIADNIGCTVFASAVLGDGKVLDFLLQKESVLCSGFVKSHHKAGLLSAIKKEMYFACNCLTLSLAMKFGIFDWDWYVPYSFGRLSTFLAPAIKSGLCPMTMKYKEFEFSVLARAFIEFRVPEIKFLLAHRYFFPEDYVLLSSNIGFRDEILHKAASDKYNQPHVKETLRLLDQLILRPLSLQTWTFLSISKAISVAGPPNRRSDRVNSLHLPQSMKNVLKFQTSVSELCLYEWDVITEQEAFDSLNFRQEIPRTKEELKCDNEECLECNGDWQSFRAHVRNCW